MTKEYTAIVNTNYMITFTADEDEDPVEAAMDYADFELSFRDYEEMSITNIEEV